MPPAEAKDVETRRTDEIVCPHCGREQSDSWEWADSDDDAECGHCGGRFHYERNITVTYSSGMTEEQKTAGKLCEPD